MVSPWYQVNCIKHGIIGNTNNMCDMCADEPQERHYKTHQRAAQVGGDHYSKQAFQPIEYIMANNLGFNEGNIVKYITRHKDKGGAQDIEKIKEYCDFILKYQYGK